MKFSNVTLLTPANVIAIHKRVLTEEGAPGIRDERAISAAIEAAHNTRIYTICDLAAEYCWHLTRKSPFVDGNKRTALLASMSFLLANGFMPTIGNGWVEYMGRVTNGILDRKQLTELFVTAIKRDESFDSED